MRRVAWLLLGLIVAAGLFFRLYRLDEIPPGMTHDEADVGYHAAVVYETGQRHVVDQPYGFIHQPFVQYSGALWMHLFGPTDNAQRLHSVFFGTLLIIATYCWARLAFDTSIALAAAAFMSIGFWPVMTSRFALNNQPVPAIFTIGVLLLWRSLFRDTTRRGCLLLVVAAGFFLGLSVYPYEAGRAALASIPVSLVYLLLFSHPRLSRASRIAFGIVLAVAFLVAAPHLLDPRSWGRTGTLVSETVGAGGADSLLAASVEGLGTIFLRGDPFVTYNIPGRPIFDPILAVPFVAGFIAAARNWRTPAYGFTLIWLLFGLVPTLVVGAFTSTIHSIAAQPPVFVLLGIGLVTIARFAARSRAMLAPLVVGALLIYSAATTFNDTFNAWGSEPAVRAAYYNYFASMIDAVNARTGARDIAISSAFPDKPLDPFIAARLLRRDDVTLRHFNATRALVFPDADSALLLVPSLTPIPWEIGQRLGFPPPSVVLQSHPADAFDAYDWNPRAASEQLASQLEPFSTIFGGAIELIGAAIHHPQLPPWRDDAIITLWRVLDPAALGPIDPAKYDREAVLFTHMVDGKGAPLAQDDRLDAPASSWRAGDTFVQVHRLAVGLDVAPGRYRVVVGIYTLPALSRLPASTGGDSVTIGEIRVGPAP